MWPLRRCISLQKHNLLACSLQFSSSMGFQVCDRPPRTNVRTSLSCTLMMKEMFTIKHLISSGAFKQIRCLITSTGDGAFAIVVSNIGADIDFYHCTYCIQKKSLFTYIHMTCHVMDFSENQKTVNLFKLHLNNFSWATFRDFQPTWPQFSSRWNQLSSKSE